MAIFNMFKKNNKFSNSTTDNGISGPTFLDGLTEHIANPKDLHSHEWRRKLKTNSERTKFKIKYYGELHKDYRNLIVGTDFAPSLVFAIDIETGQEILLFDGCKHGYNAMFCNAYNDDQIENRPVENYYQNKNGSEIFEIIVSTYNGIDYEDEFKKEVDENGLIEIVDGTKIEFETAKRNGYDTLQIWAIDEKGEMIDFVSEELA